MSMCKVFSCVFGRGYLLWPVRSLGKTLLAFALLLYSKAKFACYSRGFLTFTLVFQSPKWKGHLFWLLVVKGLGSLHRTVQLQLLQHYWWGIDLDYRDIELFALKTNRDHSVVFEIASKYCISDSLVDYDGYSISSKGFLPTVVDILVIWVKFTYSSPF